jgi:hypothetical protein
MSLAFCGMHVHVVLPRHAATQPPASPATPLELPLLEVEPELVLLPEELELLLVPLLVELVLRVPLLDEVLLLLVEDDPLDEVVPLVNPLPPSAVDPSASSPLELASYSLPPSSEAVLRASPGSAAQAAPMHVQVASTHPRRAVRGALMPMPPWSALTYCADDTVHFPPTQRTAFDELLQQSPAVMQVDPTSWHAILLTLTHIPPSQKPEQHS